MCGVAFTFSPGDAGVTQRMQSAVKAMDHRGPDACGVEVLGGALLGHNRLSILDLGASHQPMLSRDGRYGLVFNGEIYNFRELRHDLEKNWSFSTSGDTEVLLAGLVLQGPSFLDSLSGMWAFVLWDALEQKLLAARDPTGKKPLYFTQGDPSRFHTASEIPALRRLSPESWTEDDASTADYFRYGCTMPGKTAYREVQEVLPGHFLVWQPGASPVQQRYWSLRLGGEPLSPESARQTLNTLFRQAVERRMIADVEVGAFLSGGVDSSLVVGAMTRSGVQGLRTFTIRFNDASYDESPYAQRIARHFGTRHLVESFDDIAPDHILPLLNSNLGQPFADASILPTQLVSRVAAGHVKVVLSGDGGDELFAGYQRYFARVVLAWYSRLPTSARRLGERLIEWFPEPRAHHSRSLLKRARLFVEAARAYRETQTYVAPWLFAPQVYRQLFPQIVNEGHCPPTIPDQTRPDDLQRMMASDMLIYLPQDILQKVDRASMAQSLEVRSPFLDKDLIQFAFSMPSRIHRQQSRGKQLLERAFGDWLPPEIWRRNKQGFGIPLHRWFQGMLSEQLIEMAEACTSPIHLPSLRQLIQEHRSGSRDHGIALWGLYTYFLWRQTQFFRQPE